MKCSKCDGRKKILEPCDGALLGTVLVTCDVCDGTGEVTMTNEEWFCGLNTEEKADFFCTVQHCLTIYGDHIATIEDWEKWLKENHNG